MKSLKIQLIPLEIHFQNKINSTNLMPLLWKDLKLKSIKNNQSIVLLLIKRKKLITLLKAHTILINHMIIPGDNKQNNKMNKASLKIQTLKKWWMLKLKCCSNTLGCSKWWCIREWWEASHLPINMGCILKWWANIIQCNLNNSKCLINCQLIIWTKMLKWECPLSWWIKCLPKIWILLMNQYKILKCTKIKILSLKRIHHNSRFNKF